MCIRRFVCLLVSHPCLYCVCVFHLLRFVCCMRPPLSQPGARYYIIASSGGGAGGRQDRAQRDEHPPHLRGRHQRSGASGAPNQLLRSKRCSRADHPALTHDTRHRQERRCYPSPHHQARAADANRRRRPTDRGRSAAPGLARANHLGPHHTPTLPTRLPHTSAGETEFEGWEAGEVGGSKKGHGGG